MTKRNSQQLTQATIILNRQSAVIKQLEAERDEARQVATDFFAAYAELAAVLGFDLEMLQSGQVQHEQIVNKLKLYMQEALNEPKG